MQPESPDMHAEIASRLAVARAIARDAAAVLLRYRGRHGLVDHKGSVDLVTIADRESESLVTTAIIAAFPDDRIIGEEGASIGDANAPFCWFIDPLDGTTNYVAGLPHFAVSLGATLAGVPTIGVVHAPVLGHVFWGATGQGASRTDFAPNDPSAAPSAETPLRVHPATRASDALAATGYPYDRRAHGPALTEAVARALEHCLCVRRLGSAALDLALTASGVFGLYWEPRLKPWDFVAGVALVREAGGCVTDFDGGVDFSAGNIAASNGHLHSLLLSAIIHPPDPSNR